MKDYMKRETYQHETDGNGCFNPFIWGDDNHGGINNDKRKAKRAARRRMKQEFKRKLRDDYDW